VNKLVIEQEGIEICWSRSGWHFRVDGFEVSMHVSTLREFSITDRALVRLFPGVDALVFGESGKVTERIRTVRTFERTFSSVDAHVSRQTGSLDEVLVTLFALVAAAEFGAVSSQMSPESGLTGEELDTLFTVAGLLFDPLFRTSQFFDVGEVDTGKGPLFEGQ
jgi:hypothetical protein